MEEDRKRRRRHSAELKSQVLDACARPGASIAAVALTFGLNANLVRQWRVGRGMKRARGAALAKADDAGAQLKFIALPPKFDTERPDFLVQGREKFLLDNHLARWELGNR
jgi:hypothetical protein